MDDFDNRLERLRPLLRMHVRQMKLNPKLRRRFDSSDIVQMTMLKAHKNREQFRGHSEPEFIKWIHRILENEAVEAVRRENSLKRDPDREVHQAILESSACIERQLEARGLSPSEEAEKREELLSVAKAIDELPEEQREVFMLREVMDCPIADIAARLEKTEKAVAGLLLRARQRFRELRGQTF